jgi:hypothetical protein
MKNITPPQYQGSLSHFLAPSSDVSIPSDYPIHNEMGPIDDGLFDRNHGVGTSRQWCSRRYRARRSRGQRARLCVARKHGFSD